MFSGKCGEKEIILLNIESVQQKEAEFALAQAEERISMNSPFTTKEIAYLQSQIPGRLATSNEQGELHVVPVRFSYNAELGTIDIGGARGGFGASRKFRDVARTGKAAFVVDDVVPPHHIRGIEIRGRAEAFSEGGEQLRPGGDPAFIRLWPTHIVSWGIEQEEYHPYSRKVEERQNNAPS